MSCFCPPILREIPIFKQTPDIQLKEPNRSQTALEFGWTQQGLQHSIRPGKVSNWEWSAEDFKPSLPKMDPACKVKLSSYLDYYIFELL